MRFEDLPPHLQAQARKQLGDVPASSGTGTSGSTKKRRHGRQYKAGEMNGMERDYSRYLDYRKLAGEIAAWQFERFIVELAPGCTLKLDFTVWTLDGHLEVHETKGHMEDDAAAKLRILRDQYPHMRLLIVRREGGEWDFEER